MSATVLYMSVSLDGFIAGPNDTADNALGDDGHRLHQWILPEGGNEKDLDDIRRSGTVNGGIVEEFMSTGALVIGRRTFEFAGGFDGDHHDGVPVFIVGRKKLGIDISGWPHFTYLGDITEAVTLAKEAAGDKNVMVHGAELTKLALEAGVLDELELHMVPVLLGQGRRLFDGLPAEQIELERTRVLEGEGVTHMHYKVIR
jgi:dihydrofolate reductase